MELRFRFPLLRMWTVTCESSRTAASQVNNIRTRAEVSR